MKFTGEMSNSGENGPVEGDVKISDDPEWLTPAQAADLLGVNHRYVYRLIESRELESDGKKHGKKVTRESVETARIKRLLTANSDVNFTGEASNSGEVQNEESISPENQRILSKRENNQMGAIALQGIQGERDKLLELYNQAQEKWRSDLAELQEQWRADINRMQDERRKEAVESAMSISQLTERVKTLEGQLQTAQQATAAQEAQKPLAPLETIPPVQIAPQAAQEPEKKRRWWWF
jgi:hypothetical protein